MPQSTLTSWFSKASPAPTVVENGEQNVKPQQETLDHDKTRGDNLEDEPTHLTSKYPSKLKLPPNVELRACRKEDIKGFKKLNSLLLPIPYGDSFYREILEDDLTNSITLMALWHDDASNLDKEKGLLVGAIRCRLFAQPLVDASSIKRKRGPMLYLSTLVLLSPYRSHGIASCMLELMVKRAVEDHGITSIGAHVWEANEEGLAWYHKRGFREVGREEGYYRRLNPQGAVVMQKDVGVMDLVAG